MGLKKFSPSMAVAVLALVLSMTGGALAAVNFARNAGAVDGFSAVRPTASLVKAAGKLVATDELGKIPYKFLSGTARAERGEKVVAAPDNGTSAPEVVLDLGLGTLLVACLDAQPAAGLVNPTTRVAITNYSGASLNVARRAGDGQGSVKSIAAGASDTFEDGGQAVFDAQVQGLDQTIFIHGGVRQGGQGTAAGSCNVFVTALFTDKTG